MRLEYRNGTMLKNMETTRGRVILGDIASWRGVIDKGAVREGSEACFSLPLPREKIFSLFGRYQLEPFAADCRSCSGRVRKLRHNHGLDQQSAIMLSMREQ